MRLLVALCGLILLTACSPAAPTPVAYSTVDLVVGTGAEATNGKLLSVRYTGWLYDSKGTDQKGSQFDSGTFSFTLGVGQVVRGFDMGVLGMKVGGKRRIAIPPELGYGSQRVGSIPADSSLIFEVELLSVQ
jgi:FKBP-type peptidyl-prolyl cis-trans isomerase FkpA